MEKLNALIKVELKRIESGDVQICITIGLHNAWN